MTLSNVNSIVSRGSGRPDYQEDRELVYWGKVSGFPYLTASHDDEFYCASLAGFGANYFYGWYIRVIRKNDGTVTSPFAESRVCNTYVSGTPSIAYQESGSGYFSLSTPFSADLEEGDEIYVIHPDVAVPSGAIGAKTDDPLGIPSSTGSALAYLKGIAKNKQSLLKLAAAALCLYYDGTYLYAGTNDSPAKVYQIDPVSMTILQTWTGASGQNSCRAITGDGTYIYAALYVNPGVVVKIDISDMTSDSTWTGAVGQSNCLELAFDFTTETEIFVGLNTDPGQVVQISTATMTTVATWTGAAGETSVTGLLYDGTYVVVSVSRNPVRVLQIDKATMTTNATFTAAAGNTDSYSITYDGVYYYVGVNNAFTYTTILKITPATMLIDSSWIDPTSNSRAYGLLFDGTFLYCHNTSTYTIFKIKTSDLTTICTWRDPTLGGSGTLTDATDGEYLYLNITTDAGTAYILKIKIEIQDTENVAALVAAKTRQLFTMDFWSAPQEEVAIPAVAATLSLPTITVADLPSGATVVRAIAMVKFRAIENINAAVNKLDGATVAATSQVIQVRDDTPGTWRDAIKFVDDQFGLAALTREGGDVLIGDTDIAVEVDGNDDYNFQYLLAKADLLGINWNDVQVGLRIWYSV